MKVIVCGGRHYADADQLFRILDKLDADLGIVTLIHGDAHGADRLAGSWGQARSKEVIAVPAEWNRYGKAAGHLRNQRMLDMEPDAVIAFPGGRGTADMMRRAIWAGVPVFDVASLRL